MEHSCGQIQISPEALPSIPSWFGEVAVFAHRLPHAGILKASQEQVRFARARFGTYDLIDFVVVLIGYAVSSEPTLKAFYERLAPKASPFMALFGRNQLPHRSTLSRFRGSRSTSPRWRPCARFFKRIGFLATRLLPLVAWLIEQAGNGS
jgi:hypothetical protein